MNGEEAKQFQQIRTQILEAHGLYQQLVHDHQEAITTVIRSKLSGKTKEVQSLLIKILTRCRNEIIACYLPPDFKAWACELADEILALYNQPQSGKQLRAIRPEILPDVELTKNAMLSDDEQQTLCDFKEKVNAIKSCFWVVIGLPHRTPNGAAADKRTLLLRYGLNRGLAHADAEDIADATLLKALIRLHQYKPKAKKQFMNWLYTVAWNTLIDSVRVRDKGFGQEPESHQPLDRSTSTHRKAYEEVSAVLAISYLAQSGVNDPEGVPKVLICFFHQVMGHKPKEIAAEMGHFSLQNLLEKFREMCLRLDAFDGNEALVDELVQPLQQQLDNGSLKDLELSHFWQTQKRADYYIQNVSRRTWERVAKQVEADFPEQKPPDRNRVNWR